MINEIKKGDYVNSMGEVGIVNKVKGQVAYVKFPSRPGSFHPILASSLKKSSKKVKGKDIYTESINEAKFYVTYNKGRGQGKAVVTSPESDFTKPRVFKSYKDAEKYIGKPTGMTAYWVSDINMNRIDKRGKIEEASSLAKKHGKFGLTNVPFPTEEPNEFAYIDFKKYVKKNEKNLKKVLDRLKDDKRFKAVELFWKEWDKKANQGAFSNIKGNKFGRELTLMLRKDGLLFDNKGNKITNLKEFARQLYEKTSLWKAFDAKMKLQDEIMDLEMDMKEITKDIGQLHKDMEQEAEPGGGKIADRYGRDIEKKEKQYKKKKAEFKKLMKKLDKMEQELF